MTADAVQRGQPVRLQKYLSRAGVASRREGERLIVEGRVSVDGKVVTELGTQVLAGRQVVCVDGEPVDLRSLRWLAIFKPAGYLTTRKDERGRPTVYSLLPASDEELFHVGRLDRLSEGLLLFTNDGETAHRLMHPSYRIARRYRAEVEGQVGPAEARRLENGVTLEDGVARAENVRIGPTQGRGRAATSVIQLTLREGRKREVRRMMEVLDLPVKRLVRLSFGPVGLGSLKPGKWRELAAEEVQALRAIVGLRGSDGDT
ncbi:MAG: rRNA pseudouridine synthase [Gemmatimonadota bacterium]|nr:MAG: rRNA pseudouridine synthase [Gemmatimonadota bacterium]